MVILLKLEHFIEDGNFSTALLTGVEGSDNMRNGTD